MPFSTTIAAVIVNMLATFLPLMGINIGSEALTTTVATLVTLATGIWIWKERVVKGDVSGLGLRK